MRIYVAAWSILAACGGDGKPAATDCHADPTVCGDHATCTDAGCVCGDGFTGDATSGCMDIDECADGTAMCDPIDTCINTDGSFTCMPPPPNFVALAAGGATACALSDDHRAWCWGEQYGLAPFALDGKWLQLGVGSLHTCGLHVDGTLWCWGANSVGQLGTGDTNGTTTPVQIGTRVYAEVTADAMRTCAITADDRTAWCWGDGTLAPTQAGTASWTHLAAGAHHACGIQADGKLYCWGANDNEQLGLGEGPDLAVPTLVDNNADWIAVTASSTVTCGLRSTTPYCWGGTALATGGPSTSPVGWMTPEVVTLSEATTIAVGETVGCATAPDGLWCWGDDDRAQIGDGDDGFVHQDGPQRIARDIPLAVAVGDAFGCAIDSTHHIACWGSNERGALGRGTMAAHASPTRVGTGTDWTAISEADSTACGVHATGVAECWGEHGNGDGLTVHHEVPAHLYGNLTVASVGVLEDGGCAITTAGALWCWGGGAPIAQLGSATTWTAVGSGLAHHECGLQGGALYCWGANTHGELGLGSADATTHAPTQVGSATDWQRVVPYFASTCGLRAGMLFCWGDMYGNAPVQIGTDANWSALATTPYYGLRGGALYGWSPTTAPVVESTLVDWQVVAGLYGIRADHTLWDWLSMQQVGGDTDWADLVEGGALDLCARKLGGSLWCFGPDGTSGDLGLGDAWGSTPAPVVGLP